MEYKVLQMSELSYPIIKSSIYGVHLTKSQQGHWGNWVQFWKKKQRESLKQTKVNAACVRFSKRCFGLTNGQTDGWTELWTDKSSFRDAVPHLKMRWKFQNYKVHLKKVHLKKGKNKKLYLSQIWKKKMKTENVSIRVCQKGSTGRKHLRSWHNRRSRKFSTKWH